MASCDVTGSSASGNRFFHPQTGDMQGNKCADPLALQETQLDTQSVPAADSPVLKPSDFSSQKDTRWDAPIEKKRDPDIQRADALVKSAKSYGEEALSTFNVPASSADITGMLNTGDLESSDVWCVIKDKTLSENMRAWADKARWSIKWLAEYDYPIVSPFCISGTFPQAIGSVIGAYANTAQVLSLDLYPKQNIATISSK
ncbi:TcpQ domain-containing protein [Dryocola boscaweniae]|uniref:Toxin co-regulated pilus biosynthesis Q family protein n=1 Tax=Dryocola boscaweniae TaxID=2925397 RepID=A0A9X3A9K9_9ENTR|nr:TcpQ domain-containing protein [Dryocola boscaweniae]MCT4700534.1 toxin co-regulated pilus biosynthesis Q family protein [Dryocola boscaweniae]